MQTMDKYLILTFGCQMNVADSQLIAGELETRGFLPTTNLADASIVVLNTCAIRDTAEQKIMAKIGSLKHWKKQKPNGIIAVGGCMTAQSAVAEKLVKTFPFVDIVFGTENLSNFGLMLDDFIKSGKKQIQLAFQEKGKRAAPVRDRKINAWVSIMHGCNNFCSYCIVPYVRGREQSRDPDEIFKEVKDLIASGYKQVTLLGQNVNSYGNDNKEKFGTFPQLLARLDKIEGDFRIRFMTSHPKDLSEELLNVIASSTHICHGLHLPFQSGSTAVLKAMNRKYTREQYLEKIKMIKKILPDAQLTGDCIVGFPGETEQDFIDTLTLAEEVEFLSLFMFVYSRRKGTPADLMEQVPDSVKKDRIKRLVAAQNKISTRVARRMVETQERLLVEDYDSKAGSYVGMTDGAKAVFVKSEQNIIGQFVNVKIERAEGSKLYAKMV